MKILAIETSCDDTCIAVAECNPFNLLSSVISSQVKLHEKYGGVYPTLARREHQKNLTPVLIEALKKAKALKREKSDKEISLEREEILSKHLNSFLKKYAKPDIDLIAVTKGPGLDPCLWTGINFAKALSSVWKIPVIGINHIEGHIFANLIDRESFPLPALALIVSGGHTQLIHIKELGKYKIIGETRDDAAGEAFDKIARLLNLGYPGGPAIEKAGQKGDATLPRPMYNTKNYDFSFSGLKTAVLYKEKKNVSALAYEAQQAIVDVLTKKTFKAAKDLKVKTIIVGGGVSANKRLQQEFKKKNTKFELLFPKHGFFTDNAAMIARVACFYGKKNTTIVSEPNLRL